MIKSLSDNQDHYLPTVEAIKEMFDCEETHILNSANSCLIAIAEKLPEPIIVADQGGWNGFIKSCELFGKEIQKIETNDGIINMEILKSRLKKNRAKSLYITSLAGYTAPQPLKEIQEICNKYGVLLIVDISASVGNPEIKKYGDIQVASTGSPKIVNIENGGFINNKTRKIELNKHLIKSLKADNITCAGIRNEIKKAPLIKTKTMEMNTYLKEKLCETLSHDNIHKIIHPTSKGLNTIITAESKKKAKTLANHIRQEINIEKNIITTGPNYNRIKKASIVIETKNLDITSLKKENMKKLSELILESIEKLDNES